MRLRVIGSSGTFPSPTNPASGYIIENGSTRVWCDAGPGTFMNLPVDDRTIDAIFLSHRHPDHCADIFAAYHAWTFCPKPRTGIPLYAHADVIRHLGAFLGSTPDDAFYTTFEMIELEDGGLASIGDLELSVVEMNHSVPDLGSLWNGSGRTLFFTGDTGPGDWSVAVEGVDLFLCEAALVGEREKDHFSGHLNGAEAGKIARDAGVGELVLTHIPPYLDKSVVVAEAEATFGRAVRLAVPGTDIKV